MDKLTTFQNQTVTYVETQQVKEGVEADLYLFADDKTKDLAIVRVTAGHKTPLQLVLKGKKTIEGYLDGQGTLTVAHPDGSNSINTYPDNTQTEVIIAINDIVQWSADTQVTFYEICWPPYEDGRFKNLS